jgi:hypothetical protein
VAEAGGRVNAERITIGTVWLDGKFRAVDETWRRLVQVGDVDSRYVYGVGWIQQQVHGVWQDTPQTSRKTRVLRDAFLRQYSPLEGP